MPLYNTEIIKTFLVYVIYNDYKTYFQVCKQITRGTISRKSSHPPWLHGLKLHDVFYNKYTKHPVGRILIT